MSVAERKSKAKSAGPSTPARMGRPIKHAPTPGTLAARFAGRRMAAGLTQAALAARMGTSPPSISRLEAGKQHPGPEWLGRAAGVLGCRVEDLVGEDDSGKKFVGSDPGKPAAQKVAHPVVTILPFFVAGYWVGATDDDRLGLEAAGFPPFIVMGEVFPRLARAMAGAGLDVSMPGDVPPVPITPDKFHRDGLGPQYRRAIYAWAAENAPTRLGGNQKLSDKLRELFWSVDVSGDDLELSCRRAGVTLRSGVSLRSLVRKAYHGVIETEAGRRAAGRIAGEIRAGWPGRAG